MLYISYKYVRKVSIFYFLFFIFLYSSSAYTIDPYKLEPFEDYENKDNIYDSKHIKSNEYPKKLHSDGIFFNPLFEKIGDNGSAFGLSGTYYFRRHNEAPKSRPSYFRSSLIFGSNQYVDTNFIFDNYWNKEFSNLFSSIYYKNRDLNFYGIAANNKEEATWQGIYHESRIGFNLLYRQKYSESAYWGIKYNFENANITKNISLEGARLSGLGIHIGNMWIDNIFAPQTGTFYEINNIFYLKYFGSEYDFAEHTIDARNYRMLWETQLLALQLYMNFLAGQEIPFTKLSSIGNTLRAYSPQMYLNKHLIALKAEYRILLMPKFATVFFLGFGYHADSIKHFMLNKNFYSYGAGLRYMIYQPLGINTRLDYAVGRNGSTWLLGIGEAF